MTETLNLLDTPKKASLHLQSVELRTALKKFERAFADSHDGHKPTKDDIRADEEIALQYKAYAKLRDVIAGKVSYEAFVAPVKSPRRRKSHTTADARISGTPQQSRHPNVYDPYDAPNSASPLPPLLSVVGPTPQRDGTVLGLFDLVPASASSSATPSSSMKKRKVDQMLDQSPRKIHHTLQTPSHSRRQVVPDLLEHLTGTPECSPPAGRHNLSRTPVSEGRKFMLSQFFATPSSVKHGALASVVPRPAQTPLRDRILGYSIATDADGGPAPDATPAYLRRSTSFKDRLMSASYQLGGNQRATDLSTARNGPPTLLHFKSGPKPLSQIVSDLRELNDGDHDDELEALRELENAEVNVQRKNSNSDVVGDTSPQDNKADANENINRVLKKRGQKRTTRRTKMRPSALSTSDAPKFVCAEDEDDEDDQENEENEESEENVVDVVVNDRGSSGTTIKSSSRGECRECNADDEEDDFYDHDESDEGDMRKSKEIGKHSSRQSTTASRRTQGATKVAPNKKSKVAESRTINPNAQSHMNFRTLKIRNKNSKAKKGGRFGRRR